MPVPSYCNEAMIHHTLKGSARMLHRWSVLLVCGFIGMLGTAAFAGESWSTKCQQWYDEIARQVTTPLFWFGMGAQVLFFLRFIWQWIVSERRKQSTIPIVFWYFSLLGGVAMVIYGVCRKDLVIILGQSLACVIYVRNLMLIYNEMAYRRQAGMPADDEKSLSGGPSRPAD